MTLANHQISRRRFIAIAATVAGEACLPRAVGAAAPPVLSWTGIALGAPAQLVLQHPDERSAKDAIAACLAEVARLEAVFSLHRPDSALVRLNATGRLDNAPPDLLVLLSEALSLAERTRGAFDPTIQPLWQARAMSDAASGNIKTSSDPASDIVAARSLVGWREVLIDEGSIKLSKPGMAVTLNGIAQGYITDKVSDLLRQRGFTSVLVDMGEHKALGAKWNGDSWRIGIENPHSPGSTIETINLTHGAVSTSSNLARAAGGLSHRPNIIDPETGEPAGYWSSVTVVCERATMADGLSTALSVLPLEQWRGLTESGIKIYAVPGGSLHGRWV
jgi:thiamine biosynthesis lipoprotein